MTKPAVAAAAAFTLFSATTAVHASRSELSAFLERAQRMSTLTIPVRADITITRTDGSTDHAVLIIDPGPPAWQYMKVASSGWRSLMPLTWKDGRAVKSAKGKPEKLGADEPIAETDFRPMEFFPCWATDFQTAFISDETRLNKTVSLYASESDPYSLYVVTFDKAKIVPATIKYYRNNFETLVRLRNDSDYTMVGSRPLPRKISIRDFTENTSTTFDLQWSVLDTVPDGLTGIDTFHQAPLD